MGRVHIPQRGVLPTRNEDRQAFLRRRHHPTVLRVDLIKLLELASHQHLVNELVREVARAVSIRPLPFLKHRGLDSAHGLLLRDAGVGHAVQVAPQQFGFVLWGQVAVVRHALVIVARDQVVEILFQVGSRAADGMDSVLSDHLCERQAEFRGAHGASQRQEHLAASVEQRAVTFGRIHQRGRIEMPVMVVNKMGDGPHFAPASDKNHRIPPAGGQNYHIMMRSGEGKEQNLDSPAVPDLQSEGPASA